jgi:A/G-specific adenine glycosylase
MPSGRLSSSKPPLTDRATAGRALPVNTKRPSPSPPTPETTVLPPGVDAASLQARILAWYAANGRDLPWRRTTDPYAVLVSEIMLQQTQVPRVIPRFAAFLERFPSLEELAAATLAEVLTVWSGLGYNNRALRLRQCALALLDRRAGGAAARLALPATLDQLERLPGIGPYTARAVMVFAHNADVAAVDANVRRVLIHELGLASDTGSARLQAVAEALVPRGRSRDWHNALMDYGSEVLTSRATGVRPLTTQSPFAGSRREYRARLLRLLLARSPRRRDELSAELGLAADATDEIVALLARDGLVRVTGDDVFVA